MNSIAQGVRRAVGVRSVPLKAGVTEIAPDTYRISTFHPGYGIQLNQFLIRDAEPFLMHTGFRGTLNAALKGVRSILDPSTLRWIGVSHFESDECGALNEWLAIAPGARPVCGVVAAAASIHDFSDRPPRALSDGEVLETGRHRLRFLATPHVPHGWDAGLFFDEVERVLFCSDLFLQPGDPEPLIESEIVQRARDAIQERREMMPYARCTHGTFQRLSALEPRILAVMHGSSFRGDGRKAILHLAAVLNDLLGNREGAC